MIAEAASPSGRWRDFTVVFAAWLVLAAISVLFARQNLSVPGLYYDEAVFAGMAKDFWTGQTHGQHLPAHEIIQVGGRQFPLFVQTYLGALKSWMLIPVFGLFGPTFAVLRGSNLFWQLMALLLLMLGARRWFGLGTAISAGALLAFDPTYFFVSVVDWGVAVPSFVCRCACFYFAIRWNQTGKLRDAFLVGLFAGFAFFNKADFIIFLIAISGAALISYWREFFAGIRKQSGSVALACLGFAIGAGPMLIKLPHNIALTVSGPHPNAPGELGIKLKTMLSMYDGTHFYRLMNVGGVFERMYDGAAGPRTALGIALVLALFTFAFIFDKHLAKARAIVFLILAIGLVSFGVFLLPDAVRIHHAVLVFPLPHLVIAAVAGLILRSPKLQRTTGLIAVTLVCLSGLRSIGATQKLIRETGGRGRWSDSLNEFCREIRSRSVLTIVSLDWGFNEQLMFFTDGPELSEPFWDFNQTLPPLPSDPDYIYLVHPAEYSVLKYDVAYVNQLQTSGANVEITPHLDRQNEVAFYAIRFRPPP
jgi:hypothetical protein